MPHRPHATRRATKLPIRTHAARQAQRAACAVHNRTHQHPHLPRTNVARFLGQVRDAEGVSENCAGSWGIGLAMHGWPVRMAGVPSRSALVLNACAWVALSALSQTPARLEKLQGLWQSTQPCRWQVCCPQELSGSRQLIGWRRDRRGAVTRRGCPASDAGAVADRQSAIPMQAPMRCRRRRPTRRVTPGVHRRSSQESGGEAFWHPTRTAPHYCGSAPPNAIEREHFAHLPGGRAASGLGTSSEGGLLGLGPLIPVSRWPRQELVEQFTSAYGRDFHHTRAEN